MLELDHIFVFTAIDAPEAEALIELGLAEGSGNVHPGQGTANRRFFFADNFLELLWVHDEQEAQSPIIASTLLWERSRWRQSGYAPFGLCVRPTAELVTQDRDFTLPDTWAYKPPYLPAHLQIDVANNGAFPHEPMLFQTPFSRPSKKAEPTPARPVQHPLGVQNITGVTLHLPAAARYSAAMKVLLETEWFSMEPAEKPHLTLELDQGRRQQVKNFAPTLPLTLKW